MLGSMSVLSMLLYNVLVFFCSTRFSLHLKKRAYSITVKHSHLNEAFVTSRDSGGYNIQEGPQLAVGSTGPLPTTENAARVYRRIYFTATLLHAVKKNCCVMFQQC